ncbi:hypothetical protein [Rhodococcus qingshengii]|uniref:hypothetical protein n=1 Tax=Rhodococcus qingshengii TaxID=334542 RepID=UPI00237C5ED5|nr:hypothetical protein [Rhodococcus qingshengii]WCT06220.1 hypothetical protein PI247_31935 [Rhodococcus qingshengii]
MTNHSGGDRPSPVFAVVAGAAAVMGWCFGIWMARHGWDLRTSDPGRGVICAPYSRDSTAMYCDGIPTWIFETGSGVLLILIAIFLSIQTIITTLACVLAVRREPASAGLGAASNRGEALAVGRGGVSPQGGGAAAGGGGAFDGELR